MTKTNKRKGKKAQEKEESPRLGGEGAPSKSQSDYTTDDAAAEDDSIKASGGSAFDSEFEYSHSSETEVEFERLAAQAAAQAAANNADGWPDDFTFADGAADGRGRCFWAIGYPESINPNFERILSEKGIRAAWKIHDKDKWPNGTLKKQHGHFIFDSTAKMSWSFVQNLCKMLGLVRPEAVVNKVGACRYLCHLDIDPERRECDRGKVKYDPMDVQTSGGFDYLSQIKATDSDLAKAKRELRNIARLINATNWADFTDFVDETRPDLNFAFSDNRVENSTRHYVQANYYRQRRDTELEIAKKQAESAKLEKKGMEYTVQCQAGQIDALLAVIDLIGIDTTKTEVIRDMLVDACAQDGD